jgi:hypothetical protein
MRNLISLVILLTSLRATAADQLTYICKTKDQKKVIITFDKAITIPENPDETTVRFSVPNRRPFRWTTSMFMGLPLKELGLIYVHFRDQGPWNEVTLEIAEDLKTATASIAVKDSNLFIYDMNCKLK